MRIGAGMVSNGGMRYKPASSPASTDMGEKIGRVTEQPLNSVAEMRLKKSVVRLGRVLVGPGILGFLQILQDFPGASPRTARAYPIGRPNNQGILRSCSFKAEPAGSFV